MKSPLRPGDPVSIGGYQLLERLGEGGMGAVYLGRHADGPLVAVKIIKPEYAHEEEFRGRFRSEVKRARQVPPFCTAAVLDADPEHRTPYLVVEYVDGPSLDEVVAKQGPLTDSNLQSVAIGVATALTAIHGAGVIHRDLKPRNVLFGLGSPKVIDFGIARALEMTSQHTRPDQMVGTVSYMAPERFDNIHRDITPAADVFAWGAVVTYAGTGRTPFRADSPTATAARILTQPPNLHGMTGPLADLVQLTLAKDPADRPTAHELLDMLLAQNTDPGMARRPIAIDPRLREAAEAAQLSGHHVSGSGPRLGRPVTSGKPGKKGRLRTVIAVTAAATLLATAAGLYSRDSGSAGPEPFNDVPTPATMPVPGAVRGPWVVDSLQRRGQWTGVSEDYGGVCDFKGGLLIQTVIPDTLCTGPAQIFAGDQTIEASFTLGNAKSCAEVKFRAVKEIHYWLDLCPGLVRIRHQGATRIETLEVVETDVLTPGQQREVLLGLYEDSAEVRIDGTVVLTATLTDPNLVAGTVALGAAPIDQYRNDSPEVEVLIAGIEIRPAGDLPSTPAENIPPFTDVRDGSSTSTVIVHAYHPKLRSMVVEPVLFMTGPEYCETFGLEVTADNPCERAWVTEDSKMTVTLPIAASPKLRSWLDDPGKCAGDPVTVGICKVSAAVLAQRIGAEGLADVTVEDGVVTAIEERFTP
ncbi:MAG TPA: serine/threonine-protein kinase [Actinoplanes sp.]|nr:serine/threonine-protein kinase [Actinoplanes sp.]